MGEEPSDELKTDLTEIANECAGSDIRLHHIHMHRYGDHIELTAHIKLAKSTTLEEAHRIADRIEHKIGKETAY